MLHVSLLAVVLVAVNKDPPLARTTCLPSNGVVQAEIGWQ